MILVSSSPNRRKILNDFGFKFEEEIPTCNEEEIKGSSALEVSQERAKAKAISVTKKYRGKKTILVGCDTVIESEGKIFGKPKTLLDAKNMLLFYSSTFHTVISSIYCLNTYTGKYEKASSISKVFFKSLEKKELEMYLASNEWKGVAGGYRIQGLISCFVEKIEGSYYGIVGLPIYELYISMKKLLGDDLYSISYIPKLK